MLQACISSACTNLTRTNSVTEWISTNRQRCCAAARRRLADDGWTPARAARKGTNKRLCFQWRAHKREATRKRRCRWRAGSVLKRAAHLLFGRVWEHERLWDAERCLCNGSVRNRSMQLAGSVGDAVTAFIHFEAGAMYKPSDWVSASGML